MNETHLIAFRDGSYKEVKPTAWKHSQWIHYALSDGSTVMVNPANVNYIQRFPIGHIPGPDDKEETKS